MATPAKKSHAPRRQTSGIPKLSENLDPNLLGSPPFRRPARSPAPKPAKLMKFAPETPVRPQTSSPSPAENHASVTPKKKACTNVKKGFDSRNRLRDVSAVGAAEENVCTPAGGDKCEAEDSVEDLEGSSKARAMRRLILEEAMSGVPEQGAGRVMYLVKTFEKLLSIPKETEVDSSGQVKKKVVNWALPGLQFRPKAKLSEFSPSPVSSSRVTVEDSEGEHSSVTSKGSRLSCGSAGSDEGRGNRGNSIGSSGRSRSKRLKVKSLQPFKLRTEQRGKFKEEQFIKKVEEMLLEEERKRRQIAQGLPWTTDEPEIPKKPPTKEPTEPVDLILHSDVRAVERAEFDVHVAERMSFIEQIKMERERLQKLEEEEEIRRLRKELVPKAQPMPYFDRPFIPKKKIIKTPDSTKGTKTSNSSPELRNHKLRDA